MKATLRKNGLRMLNLNVKFALGREDIINVVAVHLLVNQSEPKSRKAILDATRRAMHENGYWGPNDDAIREADDQPGEAAKAAGRAAELVDRYFPDLNPEAK